MEWVPESPSAAFTVVFAISNTVFRQALVKICASNNVVLNADDSTAGFRKLN